MTVSKPNYADLRQYMDDRFASVSSATAVGWTFKQDPTFFQYMEHVSKEHGAQYLQCIETQYPQVTFEALRAFVQTNDRYGGSTKFIFTFHCTVSQSTKLLYCSPSTLRYAFQALLTLDYMSKTECRCLVEWGAGYGGMFLGLQAFAGLFYPDGGLDQVVLVEMPEVVPLLTAYMAAATAAAPVVPSTFPYQVVSANGELPPVQGAFFAFLFYRAGRERAGPYPGMDGGMRARDPHLANMFRGRRGGCRVTPGGERGTHGGGGSGHGPVPCQEPLCVFLEQGVCSRIFIAKQILA